MDKQEIRKRIANANGVIAEAMEELYFYASDPPKKYEDAVRQDTIELHILLGEEIADEPGVEKVRESGRKGVPDKYEVTLSEWIAANYSGGYEDSIEIIQKCMDALKLDEINIHYSRLRKEAELNQKKELEKVADSIDYDAI